MISTRVPVAFAMSLMFVAGCTRTGYQKVDGKWTYVIWSTRAGKEVRVLNADEETFTILSDKEYAKDKDRVYYRHRTFDAADPATFQIINNDKYVKDKNHVYIETHKVRGADPATFKMIQSPYSRDAKKVYCGTVPMEVFDVDAFEPLNCGTLWSTTYDKGTFLFSFGDSFANLEVSSENPLVTATGWGRDGKYYYYGPGRVEGADYDSFKIVGNHESVDINRKYQYVFPADEFDARCQRYLSGKAP